MNQYQRFILLVRDLIVVLAGYIPALWRTADFYIRWVVGMTLVWPIFITMERLGGWGPIPVFALFAVLAVAVALSYQLPAPAGPPPPTVVPGWHGPLWILTQIGLVITLFVLMILITGAAPNVRSVLYSLVFVGALLLAVIMGYMSPMVLAVIGAFEEGRRVLEAVAVVIAIQLIYGFYLWAVPVENWPSLLAALLVISIAGPLVAAAEGRLARIATKVLAIFWVGITIAFFVPAPFVAAQERIPVWGSQAAGGIRKIGSSSGDHTAPFKTIGVPNSSEVGDGKKLILSEEGLMIGGPNSEVPSNWYFRWDTPNGCDVRLFFIDEPSFMSQFPYGVTLDTRIKGLRGKVVFAAPRGGEVDIYISPKNILDKKGAPCPDPFGPPAF